MLISQILSRDARYRRSLAVADVLSAAFAVFLGVPLLGSGDRVGIAAIAALPLVAVVSKVLGLYDRDEHLLRKTTLDEAPALFVVSMFYAMTFYLGQGFLVHADLGRDQVAALWLLLFASMLLARTLARRLAGATTMPERCLVIGDARSAERVRRKVEQSGANAGVIGRVPLSLEAQTDEGPPVLGSMSTLGLVLVEQEVHRAIVAPAHADPDEMLDVIRLVKSLGIKVSVLPRLFEVVGSSVEFDDVHGAVILGVRRYGLTKSSRATKRAMDVVGAAVILAALAPLMIAVAIAIKLDSAGPVLFRQTRVGRRGRAFRITKFRTMRAGAEHERDALRHLNEADGGLFKIDDDPRATRVGGWLRRSAIDELPQLFNVLRGEMSLVGPRPLVPDEDKLVEGWDRRRLLETPGLTGPWQIFGSARVPLPEMVKIDYLYWANWSLWRDVKILLRTVPYAFARRGQ